MKRVNEMSDATLSVIIFVLVMVVIISEKVHRAVCAVGGAVLLIILGVLDIGTGVSYIDYNTIGLLIGMMMFVAVVKHSGMFEYLAVKSAKVAKGDPWKMMIFFIIITAVLSGLLDNVTTVLLVGPMTFAITKEMDLNPVPYIMTQILASNIGGTGTLIGDPPNIMIGSATGLTFGDFLVNDGLIVIVVLAATIAAFYFIYGKKLNATPEAMAKVMAMDEKSLIRDKKLLIKSIVMIVLIVAGFMLHSVLHMESSIIALSGAVIMMIIGRQNIEEVVSDVEWPTIIFFTALFIVVGGMVETGVIDKLADLIMGERNRRSGCPDDDDHSVGIGTPVLYTGQYPVCSNDDPADHGYGQRRYGCYASVVGTVTWCMPGRKRNTDRSFCKCSTDWYQCQERSSGYIHAVPEDRIPDDDPVHSDLLSIHADPLRIEII